MMEIETDQTKQSIYNTKQLGLESQCLTNPIASPVNLQTSVNSSNLYASNDFISNSTYTCYRLPHQQSTILDGIDHLMSGDLILKDSNEIQEKESENDKYVNSITNGISQASFNDIQINSYENSNENTELNDKGYKSLFESDQIFLSVSITTFNPSTPMAYQS